MAYQLGKNRRNVTSTGSPKPQKNQTWLYSRRFTIVGSSVLHGVSTDIAVDTSIECRARCRSICQPTIGRPIYGRHSTAAVYRPTVDRCVVVIYHRRNTTDVSSNLLLHVVNTIVAFHFHLPTECAIFKTIRKPTLFCLNHPRIFGGRGSL